MENINRRPATAVWQRVNPDRPNGGSAFLRNCWHNFTLAVFRPRGSVFDG
jgi:hypothetical protein